MHFIFISVDDYEDTRETQNHEVCNKECFQKFTSEIYREGHDTDEMCSRVEDVGHLMYAAVCAMILSDMKQHKYVDYFSSTSGNHQQPRMTRGIESDDSNESTDIKEIIYAQR